MKKIFEKLTSSDRFRFYMSMIGGMLFILIMLYLLFVPSPKVDYETVYRESENILQQTPLAVNTLYEDNIFYVPPYYVKEPGENSYILTQDNAIFTIYFGLNSPVNQEYLDSFNPDLELLYSYSESNLDGSITNYFYIWNYSTTGNVQYDEVVIGINDTYISGVFQEDLMEKYVIDMSNILNSITKTKE